MTESCPDNSTEPMPDQQVRDASLKQTQAGRDVLLHAMHRLEEALLTAAPGRERAWAKRVSEKLLQVEQALNDHAMTEAQDGLFAIILDAKPNLFHRVERLRREHSDLIRQAGALREQVDHHGDDELPNFSDIRQRAAWLLQAIRHHHASDADLIYEAFWMEDGVCD